MPKILLVDKTFLANEKFNFLTCPALAIPVLEKTYYPKFFWFATLEELKSAMSKLKPLIVLDTADKYPADNKIPAQFRTADSVYCIRAWEQIPDREWNIIRNNICEPDNHNFTFQWGTDNFNDPVIQAAKKRRELEESQAKEYDKKELAEYMAAHKSGGKRHPLLNT